MSTNNIILKSDDFKQFMLLLLVADQIHDFTNKDRLKNEELRTHLISIFNSTQSVGMSVSGGNSPPTRRRSLPLVLRRGELPPVGSWCRYEIEGEWDIPLGSTTKMGAAGLFGGRTLDIEQGVGPGTFGPEEASTTGVGLGASGAACIMLALVLFREEQRELLLNPLKDISKEVHPDEIAKQGRGAWMGIAIWFIAMVFGTIAI